jgi:hypothetical protein
VEVNQQICGISKWLSVDMDVLIMDSQLEELIVGAKIRIISSLMEKLSSEANYHNDFNQICLDIKSRHRKLYARWQENI